MCVFCSIANGKAEASILYEDDLCIAFMNIRPIHPGEFMVIPRAHIDHFTDIPDELAGHSMIIAQRYGRRLMQLVQPKRIGYVVHGFGVAHAHLNVVPQHNDDDIISARHVIIEGGVMRISDEALEVPTRQALDAIAAQLADLNTL